MDPILKEQPDTETWLAILDALRGEVRKGRLCSITFMLRTPENPDNAIIDHFGPAELTEIACRKTVEQIATVVERTDAALAASIRAGLPSATGVAPA